MDSFITPQARPALNRALIQMTGALELLDEANAPGEIGSTLDLAIARLCKLLRPGEHAALDVEPAKAMLRDEFSRPVEGR